MELVFVALAALFVIGVALIFFGRKKEDTVEASSDPEPFKQPTSKRIFMDFVIRETNKLLKT